MAIIPEGEQNILVSACLAGISRNYKGKASPNETVLRLMTEGRAIPVCPEELGGIPSPFKPAERIGEKICTNDGQDVTNEFTTGAERAVSLALLIGCRLAITKSKSPSCGSGCIFSGKFDGQLIPGDGIFVEKLKQAGIQVISEAELG